MAKSKGSPSVIFITRSKIQFFANNLKDVISMELGADVFSDLEVTNSEALAKQIDSFITKAKLVGGPTRIVFSESSTFRQDFAKPKPGLREKMVGDFRGSVPLDMPLVRMFDTSKVVQMVAVNRDLSDLVKISFSKRDFVVEGVLPAYIFGNEFLAITDLDPKHAKQFISKSGKYGEYDLEFGNQGADANGQAPQKSQTKVWYKDKRTLILLGVFLVLLLGLGVAALLL